MELNIKAWHRRNRRRGEDCNIACHRRELVYLAAQP